MFNTHGTINKIKTPLFSVSFEKFYCDINLIINVWQITIARDILKKRQNNMNILKT